MFKYLGVFFVFLMGYSGKAAAFNTSSESPIARKVITSRAWPYAEGVEEIIRFMLETIGLEASFEIKRANVPNAAAVTYQGKRYILYNPSFMAIMNKAAGTPWAAVAVLAHEVGHHLNGHTMDGKGSLPAIELEADEFSGFILRKMGASLEESQIAMRIIASARATATHPARNDRLAAIAKGWNRADEQASGGDLVYQPDPSKNEQPAVLPEQYISYDVHFKSDPQASYHVTVRNNLVKVFNSQIHILGKLWATGKTSFPLTFQTGPDEFLLISKKGEIFDERGRSLGHITPRR